MTDFRNNLGRKFFSGTCGASLALLPLLVFSHSLTTILLVFILISLLIRMDMLAGRMRQPFKGIPGIYILFFSFVAWAALSSVLNHVSILDLRRFFSYTPILIIPALSMGSGSGRFRRLALISSVCGAILVLGALGIREAGWVFPGARIWEFGRLRGFAGHAIPAAGLFTALALLCIPFSFEDGTHRNQRLVFSALFLINGVGVVLTQSRSYYIAFSLIIVCFFAFWSKRRKVWWMGGFLILLSFVYVGAQPELVARIETMTDLSYGSNAHRLAMWQVGWDVLTESPRHFLFGIGYGAWKEQSELYFGRYLPSLMVVSKHTHVHNIPLQIAMETGLIGLGLYGGLFFSLIRPLVEAVRLSGREPESEQRLFVIGTLLVVASYIIAGMFDYLHMPVSLLSLYIIVAFGLAAAQQIREQHAQTHVTKPDTKPDIGTNSPV